MEETPGPDGSALEACGAEARGLDPSHAGHESDGRAVYGLTYYILMVTRRRLPFFADGEARDLCEALMREIATSIGCEVVRCEIRPSQVVVEVKAPPTRAPHSIATRLRHDAAGPLKARFPEIARSGAAFARQYMVTTAPVAEADGAHFEAQVPRF